jgi:hypothetical protein
MSERVKHGTRTVLHSFRISLSTTGRRTELSTIPEREEKKEQTDKKPFTHSFSPRPEDARRGGGLGQRLR